MSSSLNYENSNNLLTPKTKFSQEPLNDNTSDLSDRDLLNFNENSSLNPESSSKKLKPKRKSKSFDPNYQKSEDLYKSIFSDPNPKSDFSKTSNFNHLLFDTNSNFTQKNLPSLNPVLSKKDSIDSWVDRSSKILEKLKENSGAGRNLKNSFNDSVLFPNY